MRRRVTLMVIAITAIFGICWVPDIIAHSIDYYTSLSTSYSAYAVIHMLVLFNSTVNPFVYALTSQSFREKLKGVICCRSTLSKGVWSTITRKPTDAKKSSENGNNKKGTAKQRSSEWRQECLTPEFKVISCKERQFCFIKLVNPSIVIQRNQKL